MRRLAPAAALSLAASLLAGCGAGAGTTRSAGAAGSATSPTMATRTVTRTTRPAAGTETSGTSAPPPTPGAHPVTLCRAAELALTFLGGRGATGHGELGFALRNTSGAPCHTYGYPGVLFLSAGGGPLPTDPTHTTADYFGDTTERAITLVPGQLASFRLGVTHVGTGGSDAGCATAGALQVIAPDDTATLRVALGASGAQECGGRVTVSPLQAGAGALG